jgi:hypothetical protein
MDNIFKKGIAILKTNFVDDDGKEPSNIKK